MSPKPISHEPYLTCVSGIARFSCLKLRTESCVASCSAAARNDCAAGDFGSPTQIGMPVSPPMRIGS